MKSLHSSTQTLIKNILRKKDPLLGDLLLNWDKIIGNTIFENTYPIKIIDLKQEKKRIKVLMLATLLPSLGTKIYFSQNLILERISLYIGDNPIKKIKIA